MHFKEWVFGRYFSFEQEILILIQRKIGRIGRFIITWTIYPSLDKYESINKLLPYPNKIYFTLQSQNRRQNAEIRISSHPSINVLSTTNYARNNYNQCVPRIQGTTSKLPSTPMKLDPRSINHTRDNKRSVLIERRNASITRSTLRNEGIPI